jgi:hypothetical protein
MEPQRKTEARLLPVLEELARREPIFHRPELGVTREAFEAMTDESFWEVGASGRRYSREYAIDTLLARYASPHEDQWETRDFFCQELAPELYLLTYTLAQGDRVTRRSTIWRRTAIGWRIVFHQGTMVEAE